jgi:hypothetical protein
MKFYFPDNQDQIDPFYDFILDKSNKHKILQRDDLYAHEILNPIPYNGVLVSKSVVDGDDYKPGARTGSRYSTALRNRFYREKVHKFFRLHNYPKASLTAMGDCGAFSYVNEKTPPYSVESVIEFYDRGGFDFGISVDHLILQYDKKFDTTPKEFKKNFPEMYERRDITIDLASEFLKICKENKVNFTPIGVAQGWSPDSYSQSVKELLKMGYKYIALGSLVPVNTTGILEVLDSVSPLIRNKVECHLLGIARVDYSKQFSNFGVTSFDTTSPFRRAFLDKDKNFLLSKNQYEYAAIKIPQVDGNLQIKRNILAGIIDQDEAFKYEEITLKKIRSYDQNLVSSKTVINSIKKYFDILKLDLNANIIQQMELTLKDRPWKSCKCKICKKDGIEVILLRGSNRNKRRGFSNLHNFREILDKKLNEKV